MTPLTEGDVRSLRVQTSNVTRFGICILMPLGSLIATVAGILNLSYCSRYAEMAGARMAEIIQLWVKGIDITTSYSGVLLKALERWEMAIFDFALAGVVAAMCAIGWRSIRLSNRLLKFIEDKQGKAGAAATEP